jgi:hypothetical protein
LFIFHVTLLKNERIVEEDDFTIHVLHDNDEGFHIAMDLLIPGPGDLSIRTYLGLKH